MEIKQLKKWDANRRSAGATDDKYYTDRDKIGPFSIKYISSHVYFCIEPENQNMSLPQDNRREIRADSVDPISRPWSLTDYSMSVGRKRLHARDPKHRRWCVQFITIAALCLGEILDVNFDELLKIER
jgi:hypothetical protein